MTFDDLKLIPALLNAVRIEGYTTPTPIQSQSIPHILQGRDLLGCAQTGTGKTAAFALPILQRLEGKLGGRKAIKVLVLTPTRELASQIGDSFATYGRHLHVAYGVIFGGVGQNAQSRALQQGIDILVATPGRLLDLMGQGLVDLRQVEIFVLDEADRMLDMGFLNDVRRVIAALPTQRQTLLFSATMPPDIQALARTLLKDPVRVEVTPVSSTAEKISQTVYMVEKNDKKGLLEHLLQGDKIKRVLVFTRTKHGANKVVEQLARAHISSDAIHGNKSQNARERALANFKSGKTRVLVATDIAARGIDIEEITHVINYDLPNIPESYVHRIGRTARAGSSGIAISFCAADERSFLRDIERVIRQKVPVVTGHPYESFEAEQPPAPQGQRSQRSHHPSQTNRHHPSQHNHSKAGSRPQSKPHHPQKPAHPTPARPQAPAQSKPAVAGSHKKHSHRTESDVPRKPGQAPARWQQMSQRANRSGK